MYDTCTKVIIADDIKESCNIIKRYLEDVDGIKVCDVVYNGEDAFNKICEYEPDIVILDIVMPKIDGIGVLKKINEHNFNKKPKVIMLTNANKDIITNRAFNLGASYYLIKPISKKTLLETIDMVMIEGVKSDVVLKNSVNTDANVIRKFVFDIGVPTHKLGYHYILDALTISTNYDSYDKISTQIYDVIADKYNTNYECVESAIRTAIDSASKLKTELFKEVFADIDDNAKRPSNLKFLSRATESICLMKYDDK